MKYQVSSGHLQDHIPSIVMESMLRALLPAFIALGYIKIMH